MQPPARGIAGEGGREGRETGFAIGDERSPRVGKADSIGFRPRSDAGFAFYASVVRGTGKGGVNAKLLVGVNDFELLLEKIRPCDVHLFHLLTVATGRIQRRGNGHLSVAIG